MEAFAGLILLVLGLTVLTIGRCPTPPYVNHRPTLESLKTGTRALPQAVIYGNAALDGQKTKGWWVGHFLETESGRHSQDVETKWVTHKKGAKNEAWATNRQAKTMAVLIQGRHRLEFDDNSHVILENMGDYVIWSKGVKHSWTALEKSTLMVVRWPSIEGDQINVTTSSIVRVTDVGSNETAKNNDTSRIDLQVQMQNGKEGNSTESIQKSNKEKQSMMEEKTVEKDTAEIQIPAMVIRSAQGLTI